MADRLGRQFRDLTTINEIDQAILSSLETEPIVDTVLNQMRKLIAWDGGSVSLLYTHDAQTLRTYVEPIYPGDEKLVATAQHAPEEVHALPPSTAPFAAPFSLSTTSPSATAPPPTAPSAAGASTLR